jgi:endonuclease/exonuclease/phosphatase family metal-dependent hydrolase
MRGCFTGSAIIHLSVFIALLLPWSPACSADKTFTIATYNVENYLHRKKGTRPAKAPEAKAVIRRCLLAMNADVIALQEMGAPIALLELRDALQAEGLAYPYWEHVTGWDTNIHLALLSRFPISARRPHTNDSFLLQGRRFQVSRGFAEVDIRVGADYSFTLLTAHLKSRRPVPYADEAEFRQQEASLLREKINDRLALDPNANIVVLGDFNDTQDSRPVRTILGRGRRRLIDTRPAEKNGDTHPNRNPRYAPRRITWTHYYGKEDSYSRVDYLMLSPGMAREWVKNETYVLASANWGTGSDHRPLLATFHVQEK